MHEFLFDCRIKDRTCYFYAFLCISCHHVGRTYIDFCIVTCAEDKYSRMLQIPSDNACHTEILCPVRDAREYTADSPYNQIDLHSCLGCLRYFTYKVHIGQ